ncbi:MAG: divalent-cation tolerance protein CutA [Patescibacteria group bacterium]
MSFVLIYTIHKDLAAAQVITNALLQKKIIACANFFPITSSYTWKGKIETTTEVAAILKTKINNWDVVKEYIELHHPYEVPCIIKLAEVESNSSYASWIQEETL